MKMVDYIKNIKKEFIYEQYIKIVDDYKDYEKITRSKIIEQVYDIYNDYMNIINICTCRELNY